MSDLKPCPFCGGEPAVIEAKGGGFWFIECMKPMSVDCPAFCRVGAKDKDAAVAKWNRRSVPPNVARVIEEMERIREIYGEMVPFDPATQGFDVALEREGQRRAMCLMMNYVLCGDWLKLLRGEDA